MERDILVIGIAGGTGSGKTTLMKNLIARFGDVVTVLSHDNYYRRHDDLTYEERSQLNYDEPAAMETELMVQHLQQLRAGQALAVGQLAKNGLGVETALEVQVFFKIHSKKSSNPKPAPIFCSFSMACRSICRTRSLETSSTAAISDRLRQTPSSMPKWSRRTVRWRSVS